MPFLQLVFHAVRDDLERLEAALLVTGAAAVTLEDGADESILEPKPGAMSLWKCMRVTALYGANADVKRVRKGLRDELGVDSLPPHDVQVLEDRAWERAWLDDAKALRFGTRLWICPGDTVPETVDPGESPVVLRLDPGLAFGTGAHASTALCLDWLAASNIDGPEVLDYGCGSGILAIAALKLGATHATAIDIDPQARAATRDNARRNGVEQALAVAGQLPTGPYTCDVLLANIVARALIEAASRLAGVMNPGGRLVLAGILDHEGGAVADAFGTWFDIVAAQGRGEWIRLDGIRRS